MDGLYKDDKERTRIRYFMLKFVRRWRQAYVIHVYRHSGI